MKLRSDPFSDRYKLLGNELGRGKFAVVKQCVEIATGQAFAAKIMRKQRKGQDCRADIVHEMSLLELARPCSRVIGLHDAYETHSEITLVLEFAAGGEIFHQCFGEDDEVFSEQNTVHLMRQILEGVVFMHQCNIVHLDLKPQNILLTSAVPLGDIKIADLGLSRRVSSVAELREILGTPEYVAPEILDYEPITTATDMWSIGVLAYVILTGTSPFLGEDKQETFLNISLLHVDYSPTTFTGVSQAAVDFIQTLLIKKPELRATAEQCLHHPWLQTTFFRSDETPALMTRPSDCLHESALRSPISDTFLDNNHDARLCYCKLLQFSPATPEDQRGLAL